MQISDYLKIYPIDKSDNEKWFRVVQELKKTYQAKGFSHAAR